jgi:acyl-CoA reductase-like NAD-dependent aldehyde dehydrogenase
VTQEEFARVPDAGDADLDLAVEAARAAQANWAEAAPVQRAAVLRSFSAKVRARADELAAIVCRENGQHRSLAQRSTGALVAALDYYADTIESQQQDERRVPRTFEGELVVRRTPVGVVGVITPWNYPVGLIAMKLAPALAAGCAVVIKPSPETSLDALFIADLAAEAGVPAGLINVGTGGRELGAALVSHPKIDKVAFTGSTGAGRQIASTCGEALRAVTLELGGKSAAIVLEDADLDAVREGLAFLCFANAGQSCFLNSRVLVQRSKFDQVVDLLREIAEGFVLGASDDPNATMGPLITRNQVARVESYVESARGEGATVVTGGSPTDVNGKGFFFQPTVLTGVTPQMRVFQEEIFGPVVCVLPFDDDDEAVRLANDSEFGLAGSIWTTDFDRGAALAARVETGSIGINMWTLDQNGPFGGWKASGIGKELGVEGLHEYQRVQTLYVPSTEREAA